MRSSILTALLLIGQVGAGEDNNDKAVCCWLFEDASVTLKQSLIDLDRLGKDGLWKRQALTREGPPDKSNNIDYMISPNGKFVAGLDTESIAVEFWSVETGKKIHVWKHSSKEGEKRIVQLPQRSCSKETTSTERIRHAVWLENGTFGICVNTGVITIDLEQKTNEHIAFHCFGSRNRAVPVNVKLLKSGSVIVWQTNEAEARTSLWKCGLNIDPRESILKGGIIHIEELGSTIIAIREPGNGGLVGAPRHTFENCFVAVLSNDLSESFRFGVKGRLIKVFEGGSGSLWVVNSNDGRYFVTEVLPNGSLMESKSKYELVVVPTFCKRFLDENWLIDRAIVNRTMIYCDDQGLVTRFKLQQ
jgi:hypothetical protein